MRGMAVTKVHHLDLCSMCPFTVGRMAVHALLVETSDRLVLVETGMGLDDVRSPRRRLGAGFVVMMRPDLCEEHTAARQVERLGFSRDDVRDIVVTHLDVDHAGGLPDFPHASVHVHRLERDVALARATRKDRERYRRFHFEHGPKWEVHEGGGDPWFGFESVRAVADDIVLIPMPGHSRGHACVAVKAPRGEDIDWLLHCGDAYFNVAERTSEPRRVPLAVRAFEAAIAFDDAARRENARRLRTLHESDAGKRVRMFSAHCPTEYEELLASSVRE
jgi:glyoxylase-like metal-dependent hydrolase (beta-lactamase superfamily II)